MICLKKKIYCVGALEAAEVARSHGRERERHIFMDAVHVFMHSTRCFNEVFHSSMILTYVWVCESLHALV